jgi:hypothetical protein
MCTIQFPHLDTWKVYKECGDGGVGIRLASVYESATTTSSKTLDPLHYSDYAGS